MKVWKTLLLSCAAGLCIGIGGIVYLSCEVKLAGALFFACGLYIICTQGLNLFTGKVGYAVGSGSAYWLFLAEVWLGNAVGTWLAARGAGFSRIAGIGEKAAVLCAVKLGDTTLSLFLLGIFCGLLMFAAVDGYKKTQNPLILFFCVAVFILSGFEHCVADMFYFFAAGIYTLSSLWVLLVVTVGNAVGGLLIPLIQSVREE